MTQHVLLEFVLYGVVMLVALSAPGLLLLRRIRFDSESRADLLLAMVACSLAIWGLLGLLLGYVGWYSKAVVIVALLVPLPLLLPYGRRQWSGLSGANATDPPSAMAQPWRWADRCVLGLVLLFLALAVLDALTSPFTSWDALVNWDKWAIDWARRRGVADYLFGAYGQLLPIVSSISYKLAGSYRDHLPTQTFINHGLHGLFGLLFVVALYRLARLWRLPLWPALTGLFGLALVRDYVTLGTPDVLLVSLEATSLALLVGYLEGSWTLQHSVAWVLVPVFVAVLLTKQSSVLWLALLLLLAIQFRFQHPEKFHRVFPRPFRTGLLITGLTAVCGALYYGRQYYLNLTFDVTRADPFEQVFTFEAVQFALRSHVELVFQGTRFTQQLRTVVGNVLDQYHLASGFSAALGIIFLLAFLSSLADKRFLILVPFSLAYGALFLKVASYDLRNALPVLLVCALSISGGVAFWQKQFPGRRWLRLLVSAPFGVALVLGSLTVIDGIKAKTALLIDLPHRLRVLAEPPGKKIRFFFPEFERDMDFLEATAVYPRAQHVVVASPLSRFVSHGLYPLKTMGWIMLRPGDMYSTYRGYPYVSPLPAPPDQWTLVRVGTHSFWVYDPPTGSVDRAPLLLTGVHPPRLLAREPSGLDAEFSGTGSLIAMQVSGLGSMSRGSIVWRVTLEKLNDVAPIRPFYLTSFQSVTNSRVNQQGTALIPDPVQTKAHNTLTYSGILTLEEVNLPLASTDAVIVGVESDIPGQRVRIKEFVMSQYPRG